MVRGEKMPPNVLIWPCVISPWLWRLSFWPQNITRPVIHFCVKLHRSFKLCEIPSILTNLRVWSPMHRQPQNRMPPHHSNGDGGQKVNSNHQRSMVSVMAWTTWTTGFTLFQTVERIYCCWCIRATMQTTWSQPPTSFPVLFHPATVNPSYYLQNERSVTAATLRVWNWLLSDLKHMCSTLDF